MAKAKKEQIACLIDGSRGDKSEEWRTRNRAAIKILSHQRASRLRQNVQRVTEREIGGRDLIAFLLRDSWVGRVEIDPTVAKMSSRGLLFPRVEVDCARSKIELGRVWWF